MNRKPLLERAARTLCTLEGNPQNTQFEGRPMWMSYLPQARAVLEEIRDPGDVLANIGGIAIEGAQQTSAERARGAWLIMIDAALNERPGE